MSPRFVEAARGRHTGGEIRGIGQGIHEEVDRTVCKSRHSGPRYIQAILDEVFRTRFAGPGVV